MAPLVPIESNKVALGNVANSYNSDAGAMNLAAVLIRDDTLDWN